MGCGEEQRGPASRERYLAERVFGTTSRTEQGARRRIKADPSPPFAKGATGFGMTARCGGKEVAPTATPHVTFAPRRREAPGPRHFVMWKKQLPEFGMDNKRRHSRPTLF